jgi:predicted 3-demethylubiquinone-9 3-methyltransferase (glyoxalase superfamily)
MPDITPFLWFDTEAETAAKFYVSTFPNSRVVSVTHYGPGMPKPEGSVMTEEFDLDGKRFVALNAGPEPKFNHAISFWVSVKTQTELDAYWAKLTDGGQEIMCGWLTDRYGLSWQIVPDDIGELTKSPAAMTAMMSMVKLDIAALRQAAGLA